MSATAELPRDADTPADGFGSGYHEYMLRTAFRDLCRIYGSGGAKEIAQDIIADETERNRR